MVILGHLIKRSAQLSEKLTLRNLTPLESQEKVLRRLIGRARYTAFGLHYRFDELLYADEVMDTFREQVPMFDYDKIYSEWWHRSLESEPDVTWPGVVPYFALSSGTTGSSSKYIPVTKEMIRSMRRMGLKLYMSLPKFGLPAQMFTKHMLMIGSTANLQDHGDYFVGDLSGINASKPPLWLRSFYKPGTQVAKVSSWDDRVKIIASESHKWDVGFVSGIPSWVQLTLERIIAENKVNNLQELWPDCKVFVSGGINYHPYHHTFQKLFGGSFNVIDTYLASEGFIACQTRPNPELGMTLNLNTGIYLEFVPFNDDYFDEDGQLKPNAKSLHIGEVKEGVDYALLISSVAGAWRYLIGDTVRFTNVELCEIIITGRTKHFLSITGEHLSVGNMIQGITEVERQMNIGINEFTVSAISKNGFFAHRWYIATTHAVDPEQVKNILDQKLCEVNDDYKTERTGAGVLKDIEVHLLDPSVFYEFQRHKGKMNGQSKFPRVLKGSALEEWENYLRNR